MLRRGLPFPLRARAGGAWLYWFRQELDKPPNYNDPSSIMNNAEHPNDDDVCRVAGLDPAIYVPLRQKARAAKAKKGKATP